jgi:hypothetical protein
MRVALFSRRGPSVDVQIDRWAVGLSAAGHDVVHIDIGAFARETVSFEPQEGHVVVDDKAIDPRLLDAVVLGPLPAAVGRTADATAAPSATLAVEEHYARAQVMAARHAFSWSIVLDWERRGVPVLSSPSRARPFDHKPFQLASLAAQVPVPRTLVTADPSAAVRFADAWGTCVHKPIGGGPVRTFDPHGAMSLRPGAPFLLQERVRGDDVRAVVIGGQAVAVGVFDPAGGDEVVDCRERPAFVSGLGRWQVLRDPLLDDLARRAAAVCCFDVAAVDLKRRPDGSAVVLEVNRTPVVCDLEDDLGAPVTRHLVHLVQERGARRTRPNLSSSG